MVTEFNSRTTIKCYCRQGGERQGMYYSRDKGRKQDTNLLHVHISYALGITTTVEHAEFIPISEMVEQDLERMRWQTARLQKELEEKEQKLKRSEDYMESTNIQSEEKKGACGKYISRSLIDNLGREHAGMNCGEIKGSSEARIYNMLIKFTHKVKTD